MTSAGTQSLVNKVTLDAADLRILGHLQVDAALSNQRLAALAHVSAATCLRRVKRLVDSGLIQRRVALLAPEALGGMLQVICEVSLDRQGGEHMDAFEAVATGHEAIQQCYRVSPGPDFILVAVARDMAQWGAVVAELFTQHRNVRNVKSFFVLRRSKYETAWPLPDEA